MGVKKGTLDNWIKERRDIPTVRLKQIAGITRVNLHWLITGEGEKHLNPEKEQSAGSTFSPQHNSSVTFKSEGPIIAGNTGNTIFTQNHTTRQTVTPPPGSVSEKEAAILKQWLDDLGEKLTRRDGANGYGNAHGAFKRKFNLTSYKCLPLDQLEEAVAYLKKRIRAVDGDLKKSGVVTMSRQELISVIQTLCRKELKWDDSLRKQSLMNRYGKGNLNDCTLYELESFHKYLQDKVKRKKAQPGTEEND